ncbi:MAG: hypothetical protein KBC96_09520 [Armatimonadetes bacterium]|nr:hypothetical protein [Armatimonadota bacterium]
MKRTTIIAVLTIVAIVLSVTLVYAQGRGAGFARAGQPRLYGNTQPAAGAGGWWTRTQTTTPEQNAFTETVADLHRQIRDRQFEAAQLRASNGDANRVQALEQDTQRLREQLHQYMLDNHQIRQQIGPGGRMGGSGNGQVGLPCPYGYDQPNPNAGGWWTGVQPNTPEQKAFIEKVGDLHNRIRENQLTLAQLRNGNGDPKRIADLEREGQALRTELYDYMANNQQLRQQFGGAGQGFGNGACRMQSGAMGPGQGMRMGRGGMGRGAGQGMNPNCPLAK